MQTQVSSTTDGQVEDWLKKVDESLTDYVNNENGEGYMIIIEQNDTHNGFQRIVTDVYKFKRFQVLPVSLHLQDCIWVLC